MDCSCDQNSGTSIDNTDTGFDSSDMMPNRICKKCFFTWLIVLIVVVLLCRNRKES